MVYRRASNSALFLVLANIFISPSLGVQSCYYLSGNVAPQYFVPCNASAEVSACCHTPPSSLGAGDICTTNGYCLATVAYGGLMFANGCTDPTGKAPECQTICPGPNDNWNGTGQKEDTWNIRMCSPGNACCRTIDEMSNNVDCCSDDSRLVQNFDMGLLIIPTNISNADAIIEGQYVNSSAVNSSSTPENPNTNTSSTLPATSSACPKDNSTVVGASVGAVLGVSLLAALAGLGWMFSRQKRFQQELETVKSNVYTGRYEYSDTPRQQMDPIELSAKRPLAELPPREY